MSTYPCRRPLWTSGRHGRAFDSTGCSWATIGRGTPRWNALEQEFADLGVEIVYFPYTDSTSSTHLRDALDVLHGEQD